MRHSPNFLLNSAREIRRVPRSILHRVGAEVVQHVHAQNTIETYEGSSSKWLEMDTDI
jgi:hypothetical protein